MEGKKIEIEIRVHPQTVPTTANEYHSTATHIDALGMPVAGVGGDWPYHPTPCCGAAASISDPEYGMYCKACYEPVDDAFGNVPVEPFRPIPVVKTLAVLRNGDVYVGEQRLGYVIRNERRLYEGFANDGRVLFTNADCKSTAATLLARRVGALVAGDSYRISGIPSATGGPWTVV